MNTFITLLIPAILSCIVGVITALITTNHRLRKQHDIEKEKERDRIRLKYLNPLLVASKDLLERIVDIRSRRRDEERKSQMIKWFAEIKTNERLEKPRFEYWANDEGYFAMSSLYVTAVYFSYAGKIRREFPFLELNPGDNKTLLYHISNVRTAIGGKYGIWEAIQDSLGTYLINKDDDTVINYKDFCDLIIDKSKYVWFNRLIDFYRDIHQKLEDHLDNIESYLRDLVEFLDQSLGIKRTEYKLTRQSLNKLKARDMPGDIGTKLEAMKDQAYGSEIDFVDALVSRIGQDLTDDYKPSILNHAEREKSDIRRVPPHEPKFVYLANEISSQLVSSDFVFDQGFPVAKPALWSPGSRRFIAVRDRLVTVQPFRIEKFGQTFLNPQAISIDLRKQIPGIYRIIAVHNFKIEDRNPNLQECLAAIFLARRTGDGWEEPENYPIECRTIEILDYVDTKKGLQISP